MINRAYWWLMESKSRFVRKIRRSVLKEAYYASEFHMSDSDTRNYEKRLSQLIQERSELGKFRRKTFYREILEHLNYKTGLDYIARIEQLTSSVQARELIEQSKVNDSFGRPIVFRYGNYGKVSPTTLRYISTALEISMNTRITESTSILELGCGYGGQAAILNRMFGVSNYFVIDLDPVLDLVEVYLEKINSNLSVTNGITSHGSETWDLFISNYAFSELNRDLQLYYLERFIPRCKSGYMIMNSGLTNKTGRSQGKLCLEDVRRYIPNLVYSEEIPTTGPDNYVIRW